MIYLQSGEPRAVPGWQWTFDNSGSSDRAFFHAIVLADEATAGAKQAAEKGQFLSEKPEKRPSGAKSPR